MHWSGYFVFEWLCEGVLTEQWESQSRLFTSCLVELVWVYCPRECTRHEMEKKGCWLQASLGTVYILKGTCFDAIEKEEVRVFSGLIGFLLVVVALSESPLRQSCWPSSFFFSLAEVMWVWCIYRFNHLTRFCRSPEHSTFFSLNETDENMNNLLHDYKLNFGCWGRLLAFVTGKVCCNAHTYYWI